MNCPECGHPIFLHSKIGCSHRDGQDDWASCTKASPKCGCKLTYRKAELAFVEFERDAYKAEAMAAREWIDTLELNAKYVYKTAPQRLTYLAARVKDGAK